MEGSPVFSPKFLSLFSMLFIYLKLKHLLSFITVRVSSRSFFFVNR